MDFSILITKGEEGYALLDSGDGEKLEKYGSFIVSRPDPQALWKKSLPESEWKKAQAHFTRAEEKQAKKAGWKLDKALPERWQATFAGFTFYIKPTAFKHTGLFPEQSQNWRWIEEVLTSATNKGRAASSVLNLFGYTGGATLAAARAGAEVVHVDASRTSITWARENAEISGLQDRPIRWILDDVLTFVKREIKRGKKYDGIIMDPPTFGHGPKGEVWKLEDQFIELLDACKHVLSDNPLFFIVNGYASGYSAITYRNTLEHMLKEWPGTLEVGELTIQEQASDKLLPAGIFARWRVTL